MRHGRPSWFVFSTAAAVTVMVVALMTALRATGNAKLIETAILLLGVAVVLLWLAMVLAVPIAANDDGTIAERRIGPLLAALALAALAVAPDVGNPSQIGDLQKAVLGMSAVLAGVALATPLLIRRKLHIRLARRMTSWTRVPPHVFSPARRKPQPREVIAALVVVGLSAVAFFWLVSHGGLGHDESVYALKARAWRQGTPTTGFGLHRPIGMAAVAWAVFGTGAGEAGLRVLAAAGSVVLIVLVWITGRSFLSPSAGLLTAALLAGAPSFLFRSAEFLNDVATTALILTIILLLWRHFEQTATSRWEVMLAAPLAAVAFYLRYGVVSTYVIILVVAGWLWRKELRGSIVPLGATAGTLVLLVLPHIRYAVQQTGSPIGILTKSTTAAGREYLGEGLITYMRWMPIELAGPILGWVLLIGVATTILAVFHKDVTTRRAIALLGMVGVGQLVLTGVFVHAEERYVLVATVLLGLVGSQTIADAWGRLNRPTGRMVAVAALLLFTTTTVVNVARAHTRVDEIAAEREIIREAGAALHAMAQSDDCLVMTSYIPQITWYSECATVDWELSRVPQQLLDGRAVTDFLLLFDNGKRQPTGTVLDQYLTEVPATASITITDRVGTVGDATIRVVANERSDD